MPTYRQVYTTYWQDSFILTLTPEEKYFYLYLITNTKTTLCGIYELPLPMVSFETGYPMERVRELMGKLESFGKIKYSHKTGEVCLRNWVKYNLNRSPKVKTAFEAGLREVKDQELIPYLYGMHTISSDTDTVSDTVSDTESGSESVSVSESDSKTGSESVSNTAPTTTNHHQNPIATCKAKNLDTTQAIDGTEGSEPMVLNPPTTITTNAIDSDDTNSTDTPNVAEIAWCKAKSLVKDGTNEGTDTPQPMDDTYATDPTKTVTHENNVAYTGMEKQISGYGSHLNVRLSPQELEQLRQRFPGDWQARVESLSEAMAVRGYRYDNHFAVLLKWEIPTGKKGKAPPPWQNYEVFQSDDYDFDAIEKAAARRLKEMVNKSP